MIVSASVSGLKRFKGERVELRPLTVLSGINGAGKTSFLQAVILAAQAGIAKSKSISLNGPFGLELGTAEDVLNWDSPGPIEIAFVNSDRACARWQFQVPSEDALYLDIAEEPEVPPFPFSGKARSFTYLSAERLGPQRYSLASPVPEAELEVGVRGEFSAHVLSVLGDKPIEQTERSHPSNVGASSRLLKYELEQWLSEIARPIEVNGVREPTSIIAELQFRSPGGTWVKSTNMGFGVSYALPIVLAGLIAKTGSLLLVENPEAHLHPSGQSRMGVFLAWLAGQGVQTLVETHSDHVINGIRRAIGEHQYLDPKSAIVQWFGDNNGSDFNITTALSIDESGSVSSWPKGFFDQYQIDVASLGRIRRKRTVP